MKFRKSICSAIEIISNSVAQRFSKEETDKMYPGWSIALNDLTDDQVNKGLESIMKQLGEYMPSPGEFRKHCLQEGNIEQEALSAFNLLWSNLNSSRSPYFKDACIAETVRNLGGWSTVTMWETSDRQWREKEFIANYTTNRKRDYKELNPFIENGNMPIGWIGPFLKEEKDRIKLEFKSKDEKLLLDYAKEELKKESSGQTEFSPEVVSEKMKLIRKDIEISITRKRILEDLNKEINKAKQRKRA